MKHSLSIFLLLLMLSYGVDSSKLPLVIAQVVYEWAIYLPLQAFSSMEYVLYKIWLPLSIYIRNQTRDKYTLNLAEDLPDTISGLQVTSLNILRWLNIIVGMLQTLAEFSARIVIQLEYGRDTIANLNFF